MCETFWAHFHDCFARCPDLLVQEFCSYLVDFSCFWESEVVICESVVTECEVRNALKQVGLNKSSSLLEAATHVCTYSDGYVQPLVHPSSITKGMITLLKKGGRHVWENLDDYRPITLLNTEVKILAWVLMNHLQLVISDLIRPEQNYTVKGRAIPDNLHLVCNALEGLEDSTKAMLINLDQSKAFDRVDHWFLVTVLETAGFKPEFYKWISMMYLNPQAVVQVNRKFLEAFVIEQLAWQGCHLSLYYVLTLEPLLPRLRNEEASLALHGIPFAGPLTAKVSTYTDDITLCPAV